MSEFDQEIDLNGILENVSKIKSEYDESSAQLEETIKQYQAAEKLLQKLHAQKYDLQRKVQADRLALRQAEKEAARAERLRAAQEEKMRLRREFEERAAHLDSLTASAKWREFAFDHQISGGKRLAVAKRGILADKRGLGKTLTSLIYLDMVGAKRILVLAPNDVVPQFEDEIRSWAPSRTIFSLRGLNPAARTMMYPMLKMVKEFIITLNYEAWRKDKTVIDDLVSAGIDTIILDEAHKIKSSTKQTARGVFQLAYRPNYCPTHKVKNYLGSWMTDRGVLVDRSITNNHACDECGMRLGSTVENVLSMTGTPILNKPQELFSMLHLVDPYRFDNEKNFLGDYCYSYAPNRWKFLPGGLDRLTNSMSEFFVQRDRNAAGIQIPPPARKVYKIDKDKIKYAKQYKAEKDLREAGAMVLESGEAVSMLYILEIILRERQVMTWPAGVVLKIREQNPNAENFGEVIDEIRFDVEESQKLDEAMDLLNDLMEEGERVIVFSKFKAPLYEGHNRIAHAGYKSIVATGDQSDQLKQRIREDFDLKTASVDDYKWQVMFATYDAFGTGVNLNAARHIIMLDYEWNPGMEDQAIGRIDRLNSTDQANVHIFHVNKSIDDFMEALMSEKREVAEGFETEFSAKDYLNYLRESN